MKNKIVAFIGIDGAGKTTIIEQVCEKLTQQGKICKRLYMGLGREYQIPFLEKIIEFYSKKKYQKFSKTKNGKEIIYDNYRQRSFFWIVVQYTELWARYLKAKFRKERYILFDRYFYDGLILAGKKNFNFFRFLTPKPDKCFFIWAPIKTILKRKQEANEQNIKKFNEKINHLTRYFKINKIDNSRKINIVVEDIIEKIKND